MTRITRDWILRRIPAAARWAEVLQMAAGMACVATRRCRSGRTLGLVWLRLEAMPDDSVRVGDAIMVTGETPHPGPAAVVSWDPLLRVYRVVSGRGERVCSKLSDTGGADVVSAPTYGETL